MKILNKKRREKGSTCKYKWKDARKGRNGVQRREEIRRENKKKR